MTLQRVSDLTAPPVVGKLYLVPAIEFNRCAHRSSRLRWWPVIGPKHNDVEHFGFVYQHFHYDPRFLTKAMLSEFRYIGRTRLSAALAGPLCEIEGTTHPTPALQRFKCIRREAKYPYHDAKAVIALNEEWAGKQAARAKSGWICPHRNALTGTFEPDEHGIITCPLHGLRIDAATGICAGPLTAQVSP